MTGFGVPVLTTRLSIMAGRRFVLGEYVWKSHSWTIGVEAPSSPQVGLTLQKMTARLTTGKKLSCSLRRQLVCSGPEACGCDEATEALLDKLDSTMAIRVGGTQLLQFPTLGVSTEQTCCYRRQPYRSRCWSCKLAVAEASEWGARGADKGASELVDVSTPFGY